MSPGVLAQEAEGGIGGVCACSVGGTQPAGLPAPFLTAHMLIAAAVILPLPVCGDLTLSAGGWGGTLMKFLDLPFILKELFQLGRARQLGLIFKIYLFTVLASHPVRLWV